MDSVAAYTIINYFKSNCGLLLLSSVIQHTVKIWRIADSFKWKTNSNTSLLYTNNWKGFIFTVTYSITKLWNLKTTNTTIQSDYCLPTCVSGVGTRSSKMSLPIQTIQWFYDYSPGILTTQIISSIHSSRTNFNLKIKYFIA